MEDEDFVGYELLGDSEFCTEGAEEFLKDLPEGNDTTPTTGAAHE